MRKLRCFQIGGRAIQEVLDEFNERAEEFNVSESDIVSVSAMPATREIKTHDPKSGSVRATLEVVIVYWSND